jgi:hypothetical protein
MERRRRSMGIPVRNVSRVACASSALLRRGALTEDDAPKTPNVKLPPALRQARRGLG